VSTLFPEFRILEEELMKDMDLVVLIDDENAGLDPSHLVQMMGDLLERVSSLVYFLDSS
jgi:hypothetical protein